MCICYIIPAHKPTDAINVLHCKYTYAKDLINVKRTFVAVVPCPWCEKEILFLLIHKILLR